MNKPIPFGKYFLLERINVGGMAEVFKAKAFGVEGFERLVAVKRILPNIAEDEEFITMFIDEAKIAVQLQHANIAQIFDLGKVDDSYFIALEYVYGRDLRAIFDHMRKVSDKMPTAQACYVIMQVCEGLDYAHNKRDAQGRELNLVHRDVSPQNVLVGYEGEIKLVDFGIAKAAGKASKTQAGILKGKFGYMSPEQVRGLPVDRRSDIFALGIVLYELLTGERLFIGESDFSTLEKVRNVEILPPSSFNKKIPPELERIILKALAKDVEDRYQNAIDLHDDLQAFLYSVGDFYSRKDLAAWMKKTFASELADENARNAEYEQLEEPTPPPSSSFSSRGSAHRSPAALDWDDEELETQIFDKPEHGDIIPQALSRGETGDNELSSADIFLADDADDKTVAGAPPPDIFSLGENPPTYQPVGHARPSSGPPQGLGAYRQSSTGMPAVGSQSGLSRPSASHPVAPPANNGQAPRNGAGGAARPAPSNVFKQTLMGMPAPNLGGGGNLPLPGGGGGGYSPPPGGPAPGAYGQGSVPAPLPRPSGYAPIAATTQVLGERRPLESFTQQRKRGGLLPVALVLVALGVGAIAGFKYFSRPGKLVVAVTPSDAKLFVDQSEVSGSGPFSIEKRAGSYTVAVARDGYLRAEQKIDITAGQTKRLEIALEPSPDTGFLLSSDPPGLPVWLDGKPMLGPDGQQAKTNFRANSVAPGQHVLEIKGDPRYEDWSYEFYLDAGKMLPLDSVLQPRRDAPAGSKPGEAAKPTEAKPETKVSEAAAPASEAKPEAAKPVQVKAEPAKPEAAKPKAVAVEPAESKPDPSEAPAKPAVVRKPRPRPVAAPVASATDTDDEAEAPRAAVSRCVMSINAKPWAEVWIDGKNTGKITPLVDFDIPCGKRRLTFKNKDLGVEKNESITVKSGEKFKKVFQLVDGD